ncbi:methyltransferase domain-containing protein [Actinoplanes sp. NPDC049118]|uniref:methyltransferase domain-containing protein n=1 Tax=Actinoplanes sp. NPDC049118 TaxID=3155769 RepID=UPI0033EDDDD6
MTNSWTEDLAAAYARHTGGLRGALRHALLSRALLLHLPATPQRLIDVGGGAGHQALTLARAGHHVTILDPDTAMLDEAAAALKNEPDTVTDRVVLHPAGWEDALSMFEPGSFDGVLNHGVLMYVDKPEALLTVLVQLARPGGLLSIMTKNQQVLAMRPGLQGRWGDALAVIDADTETGNLGVASRGDDPDTVADILASAGAPLVRWYGVRVFTDHLADAPVGADFDETLEAEWAAGSRDPYRRVARLFHLVAQRDTENQP